MVRICEIDLVEQMGLEPTNLVSAIDALSQIELLPHGRFVSIFSLTRRVKFPPRLAGMMKTQRTQRLYESLRALCLGGMTGIRPI